jgi:sodium-dependent dicarboxylate transporter 2/3/5
MRIFSGWTTNSKKYLAVILSFIVSATLCLIPVIFPRFLNNISYEALNLAAIFLLTLTFWVTEILPIAITALLAIILLPLLQVTDTREAFAAFMSPVFFFVIAMYIIAGVIKEVGLDKRFALFLLAKAGTRSTHVLFAMMLGTALLSSIMSDVPACAIFMAIGIGILNKAKVVPGQSQFGKALMMGIPIAALIGGIATPAGSSINVLALDLFASFSEQHQLDIHISFLQWMALGVPMVIILLPLAWWVLLRCYPPEFDTVGSVNDNKAELQVLGSLSNKEWKTLVIIVTMMALWVAGSWFKQLNVSIVALAGAIIMFMPGIQLISWEKAERHIGWDTLLMIGGVTALGRASIETGLAEWLVQSTMGGIMSWPLFWVIPMISLLTVLIHLPLPIAPVVNVVLIPPIAILAMSMDINPVLLVLPVAFTASCAFLLPLDAVPLLTFSKGYYRMFDMLLPGIIISLAWIVMITILILSLVPLLY